jgi:hypothetical protein
MEVFRELVMLTSSDLLAARVRQALPDVPLRVVHPDDLAALTFSHAAWCLILNPESWEEMARWRRLLPRRLLMGPWLMLCEPRIAGAFLSLLPEQCAFLDLSASVEELERTLGLLAAKELPPPAWVLLERFIRGIEYLPDADKVTQPTSKQLEYLCCISLGMFNAQIAEEHKVTVGSAKLVLGGARKTVPCATRAAAGCYVEQAFYYERVSRRDRKNISER